MEEDGGQREDGPGRAEDVELFALEFETVNKLCSTATLRTNVRRLLFDSLSLHRNMGSLIRPATPGFVITLAATIILAVVSFSVPLIKSVYFLKASLAAQGVNGEITFGTLGYCMTVDSSTTCSNTSVGYELSQLFSLCPPAALTLLPRCKRPGR